MKSARDWFADTLAQPPAARAAFAQAIEDAAVRREVLALLAAHAEHDSVVGPRVEAAARSAMSGHTPQRLGAYRIVGLIGEGGMGSVWEGVRDDGEFDKRVAIKIIRGIPSAAARERLKRERQVLAALEHPNIARLYDGGTTADGEPFLVIEHVHGLTLGAWLDTVPPLSARLALFETLCRSVHAAHQQLVVHCDLKPSNVIVRDDGSPVLLDFGIARLLDPGTEHARTATLAATPAYASPEQLAGRPVTLATDVFGLGMILYELLAGAVPERSERDVELPSPSRVRGRDAVRVAVPADLDRIARAAVRVEPNARYASAAALADDVAAYRAGLPVQAAGRHWRYLAGKFVRRHRLAVAAAALAVAALSTLTLSLIVQTRAAVNARANAEHEANAARATARFLQDLYAELDPAEHPGANLDARALLDIGAKRLLERRDLSDDVRARLQVSLAGIYDDIGKPAEALALEEAGYRTLQALAPDQHDALDAATMYVSTLGSASRYSEALAVADRAIPAADRLGDPILAADLHADRGLDRQTLGDSHAADDDYDVAEKYFRAAGDAGQRGLGRLLHGRAIAVEARGDFKAALALYRAAIAEKRKFLSEDDPSVLISRFGEGKILNYLGQTAESIPLLRDVLERSRRVHGPRTAATERALAELGIAERDSGDFTAALAHNDEALAIEHELNGPDSVQASIHIANRAMIAEQLGDYRAAETFTREGLAMRERLFEPDSPWIARSRHILARVLLLENRPDDAANALAPALVVRHKLRPDESDRVLSDALALEIAAHRGAATMTEREALVAAAAQTSRSPTVRVAVARAVAATDLALGDLDGAEAAVLDELAALRERHPPLHPRLAMAQLRHALVLERLGRLRDAERETADAVHALQETSAVDEKVLVEARGELARRTVGAATKFQTGASR
jgi:serine/threonine-protein kinase